MMSHLPVLGICGYSGSGKTTLILDLLPRLISKGLKVAIIKHNVPGLDVDKEGKDSDRFFKAGADVVMRGREQSFVRLQGGNEAELDVLLVDLASRYDLIILEGHKAEVNIEKIWLEKEQHEGDGGAEKALNVKRVLKWNEDRVGIMMEMIEGLLIEKATAVPVYGGVLIGGRSKRMGEPKHLLKMADGRTWLEHIVDAVEPCVREVVIIGSGDIPDTLRGLKVLPDVVDAAGPLAGILSAMRWGPFVSWLFMACDQPLITTEGLLWILGNRRPGVWAVVPETAHDKRFNPFPGYYDYRVCELLKNSDRPSMLAKEEKVISPVVPDHLEETWRNINTPLDLDNK